MGKLKKLMLLPTIRCDSNVMLTYIAQALEHVPINEDIYIDLYTYVDYEPDPGPGGIGVD